MNYGPREDGVKVPHAVLTHAMEVTPYIEEPLSSVAESMSLVSLDLRPRIRHDFFFSNRGAVDEYWQTLEYCYATTDPRAAIHAFPGSAVHEVLSLSLSLRLKLLQKKWNTMLFLVFSLFDGPY